MDKTKIEFQNLFFFNTVELLNFQNQNFKPKWMKMIN